MQSFIRSLYYTKQASVAYYLINKMAHGLSDSEMKKEFFDGQQDLDDKLDKLAQWIQESKHFIVFTGMF